MKRFRNFAGGLSQERKEPDRRVGLIHASVILRSEEHTSELQSRLHLVCRLLLEKKKRTQLLLNSHIDRLAIQIYFARFPPSVHLSTRDPGDFHDRLGQSGLNCRLT